MSKRKHEKEYKESQTQDKEAFRKYLKEVENIAKKYKNASLLHPFVVDGKKIICVVVFGDYWVEAKRVPIIVNILVPRTEYGAILCLALEIYDNPFSPLILTCYINPKSKEQVDIWLGIAEQDKLPIIYVRDGNIIDSMAVTISHNRDIYRFTYEVAERYNKKIKKYDYDKAKEEATKIIEKALREKIFVYGE
ncbi:MAG: hypothetical protein DRP01_03945 [Archaeoglobales archaeon]|nr:MAG: hypothetical protein DRP01_03945 [Archaeoglobales archaeon]